MATAGNTRKSYTQNPYKVEPPFDNSETSADIIILRTADEADFHVHKLLLSLCSPVFASMFTLPQPSIPRDAGAMTKSPEGEKPERTVIPVDDTGYALHRLLTWCDPRCIPTCQTLDDIQVVLRLAEKYDMEIVLRRAGDVLRQFVEAEPLRVFAVAVRYRFEDLARVAAKETLRFTLEERKSVPELKEISGASLQRLTEYYFGCRTAAKQVATECAWIQPHTFVWNIGGVNHCNSKSYQGKNCPSWWIAYMDIAAKALHERPRGSTVIQPDFGNNQIVEGSACGYCRPQLYPDFHRFSKVFAEEVERVISEVPLVIEY